MHGQASVCCTYLSSTLRLGLSVHIAVLVSWSIFYTLNTDIKSSEPRVIGIFCIPNCLFHQNHVTFTAMGLQNTEVPKKPIKKALATDLTIDKTKQG